MTDRLYYDDAFVREFDAEIVRTEPRDGGQAVWLDRSAFYPTSGGQPFDLGRIESFDIIDVIEEGGDVVHVVKGQGLQPGQRVHGIVDAARRQDHMQQHSGQHVLSAAFVHAFRVPTVSVHLGTEVSTIDLAREMTPAEIAAAEDGANRVIWEDRPVTIRYERAEEAAALGLRKASQRTGTLRLVDIEGFDLSACGGTHVARTGSIGAIVVRSWERFKGGQRLEFLCGQRAVSGFRGLRDIVTASVRLVSAVPADLPGAIERLHVELREQKRQLVALQAEVAVHRADQLLAQAEHHPTARLVLASLDADLAGLKALASALALRPGVLALLTSVSSPRVVVAARAGDVKVSCHDLITDLARLLGGRGGGKPDLAQAGGFAAAPDAILAEARRLLTAP